LSLHTFQFAIDKILQPPARLSILSDTLPDFSVEYRKVVTWLNG